MFDETRSLMHAERDLGRKLDYRGSNELDGGGVVFVAFSLAAMVLAGIGIFSLIEWLITAAPASYAQKTPLSSILAIIMTFSIAIVFYYLRERVALWFIYPPIELGISAGLSAAAVGQKSPLLSLIAILAAVRVAVDGINRLVTFRKKSLAEKEKRISDLEAKSRAEGLQNIVQSGEAAHV